MKKADESIQFIFITGVTKFHKVSIFSDLNQLKDISITEEYSSLCGITEEELTDIERAILFTLGISNSIKPNPIYEKWVNAIERYEMDMRGNPGEDIDDITALKNSVNIWKDMYQKEHAISGRLMKLINEGTTT